MSCLVGSSFLWLVGLCDGPFLVGWFFGWLDGWLEGCLVGWLVGQLVRGLGGLFADWMVG